MARNSGARIVIEEFASDEDVALALGVSLANVVGRKPDLLLGPFRWPQTPFDQGRSAALDPTERSYRSSV